MVRRRSVTLGISRLSTRDVGSYGGTPKPVQEYFDEVDKRIEANTDLFMRIDLAPLLADVRERAANFLGIETDECYLVTNASLGLNTIMRNFVWNAEDVIVTSTSSPLPGNNTPFWVVYQRVPSNSSHSVRDLRFDPEDGRVHPRHAPKPKGFRDAAHLPHHPRRNHRQIPRTHRMPRQSAHLLRAELGPEEEMQREDGGEGQDRRDHRQHRVDAWDVDALEGDGRDLWGVWGVECGGWGAFDWE